MTGRLVYVFRLTGIYPDAYILNNLCETQADCVLRAQICCGYDLLFKSHGCSHGLLKYSNERVKFGHCGRLECQR